MNILFPPPLLRPGWVDEGPRPVCPLCQLRHAPRPEDATATQGAS